MSNAAKGAFRGVKNMVKGYTDVQVKVRNATSNEPAGPSTADMADIAVRTEDPRLFMEIMEILDKRLNDNGKQWRHVYKSLILLDFLLHYGSDNVVNYAKENLYIVKTLKEFQYIDEDGRDQGANVRQKSKEITALLADENKLREARRSRGSGSGRRSNSPGRSNAGDDYYNEDAEIRKALEESRRTAALEERSRQASRVEYNDTDADLALALELSREEDEVRKRSRDNIDLFASIDAPQPLLQVQPYQNGQGTDPFALFAASQAQELLAAQQLQQQQLLQQQMETARQLQLQQAMKNQQILAEQERAAREALERAAREAAEKQARELAAAQAAFGLVDDGTRLRDLKNTNVQLDPFANFPRNQTPALIAQPTGSTLNPFGGTPAPSIPAPTPDPFSGFTSGGSTGAFSNPLVPTATGQSSSMYSGGGIGNQSPAFRAAASPSFSALTPPQPTAGYGGANAYGAQGGSNAFSAQGGSSAFGAQLGAGAFGAQGGSNAFGSQSNNIFGGTGGNAMGQNNNMFGGASSNPMGFGSAGMSAPSTTSNMNLGFTNTGMSSSASGADMISLQPSKNNNSILAGLDPLAPSTLPSSTPKNPFAPAGSASNNNNRGYQWDSSPSNGATLGQLSQMGGGGGSSFGQQQGMQGFGLQPIGGMGMGQQPGMNNQMFGGVQGGGQFGAHPFGSQQQQQQPSFF